MRTAGFVAGMTLGALHGGPATAEVAFSDQTAAAGLSFTPSPRNDMDGRPFYCGGTVGDFDRDGWPDLFLLGGGDVADALFMNDGDGTFTDRADDWGVDVLHRGRAATTGDFNNDGWPDLYVTSGGDLTGGDRTGQHRLYRNNGDGTFTDVAVTAGVNRASPTNTTAAGAAFGDYDLDGDLDLYVCTWEGSDGNRLFRNDGDETFTDVTEAAGLDQAFWGYSPRFVDMNGDRFPELLVVADFGTSRYFVNDGGTFTDATASSGTGLEDDGMGSAVADFNRDGLPDWYVTSIYAQLTVLDGNYLYVNQGNDSYTVLAESAGARDGGWSWGTEALDFDHDGFVDLAATNGFPAYPDKPSQLFRNNGDMTFSEIQFGSGFHHFAQGRSLLTLDYDRDGDMDIALTAYEAPFALFRNDLSGPDTHWIEIALDTDSAPGLAPDGYGSRVVANAGGVTQYAWVDGGTTYAGRSQPVAHFGLGSATVVDVTVEWADGSTTLLTDLPADQILTASPTIAATPGESSPQSDPARQMRAAYDETTGGIEVTYAPSCSSSDHTIYFGDLAEVAAYGYSGAECWCGDTGTASFDPDGLTEAFFLIVGNNGKVEGS
jgi:hypothetical protein